MMSYNHEARHGLALSILIMVWTRTDQKVAIPRALPLPDSATICHLIAEHPRLHRARCWVPGRVEIGRSQNGDIRGLKQQLIDAVKNAVLAPTLHGLENRLNFKRDRSGL